MAQAPEAIVTLHPLVGHEEPRRRVVEAHRRDRLPQSILIQGPRGIGKQRFALWIAQLSVCERPGDAPCGGCAACRLTLALEHPDVHWYMPLPRPRGVSGDRLADALENARHERLAELREQPFVPSYTPEVTGLYMGTAQNLRRRAHMRPSLAPGPVFVIGDAELLVPQEASQEAANALLKLLEEPPGASRFVLTSSVPGSLLATIRSRTAPIQLQPLRTEEVVEVLTYRPEIDREQARRIAELGHGSPGRALGFLPSEGEDQAPLNALRRDAFEIVRAAVGQRAGGTHALALAYPPAGARALADLLQFVEEWLRDLSAVTSGARDAALHPDAVEALSKLAAAQDLHASAVLDGFAAVERARDLARGNVNPQLVIFGLTTELAHALRSSAIAQGASR